MSEQVFNLPDVGEGLTEAEIVNWLVAPGDEVALNQVVCEIETAKSLVELPSPYEGVVAELLAATGETVPVGQAILRIRVAGASEAIDLQEDPAAHAAEAEEARPGATGASDSIAAETGGAVLVGYGTVAPAKSRRAGRSSAKKTEPRHTGDIVAKPPVRKLAKDLGVKLSELIGTGAGGEIVRDDVLRATARDGLFREASKTLLPGEREQFIPVKGVRKVIAENMVASKFSAPHVSVFVDIDVTRTMEYVRRLKSSSEFEGVKISPLLMFSKALIWAVRRHPEVNATWTDEEIIVRNYVNLGIAAATPRGLVVPNIKDAQELSLIELAQAIQNLTDTARLGRTQPAEMQGGTITISNFGVFGIDYGTPILNPGEVGILAMGSIKQKPWVVEGQVMPRWVTTVGGSFDHRVVDGDVISRFVVDVASVLEEPALLLD